MPLRLKRPSAGDLRNAAWVCRRVHGVGLLVSTVLRVCKILTSGELGEGLMETLLFGNSSVSLTLFQDNVVFERREAGIQASSAGVVRWGLPGQVAIHQHCRPPGWPKWIRGRGFDALGGPGSVLRRRSLRERHFRGYEIRCHQVLPCWHSLSKRICTQPKFTQPFDNGSCPCRLGPPTR